MQTLLGYDNFDLKNGIRNPIYWDTLKTINAHMLIAGKSGMGKTHTIRRLLDDIFANNTSKRLRVHIFDVHGDIDIDGASVVEFYETSPYGIQPLVINADPKFGGVRKRIQAFIACINQTTHKLGNRQESCLRNLLLDVFEANGFKQDKPETWRLDDGIQRRYPKKYPTLDDVIRFAYAKLVNLYTGADSLATKSLEQLNKKHNQFTSKQRQIHRVTDQEALTVLEKEIKELSEECVTLYSNFVKNIKTGTEIKDFIRYDSRETLKSVLERLEALRNTGIFKSTKPNFDENNPVWRYHIKNLRQEEKQMFVMLNLEEIFLSAVQNGVQDDVVDIIVLDEAHLFFSDDDDNIVNTIAKEARKFGVGLMCASQNPGHFSEDFLSNVGCKLLLGIDQTFWDATVRKLKIEQKQLQYIIPHQTVVCKMDIKGELSSRFQTINVRGL